MTDENDNNTPNERRKFRRIPVSIAVGIFLPDAPVAFDGEITNISLGGAFIRTEHNLEIGSKVLIELNFKENILIGGKVVARDELNVAEAEQPQQVSVVRWIDQGAEKGLGIEFDNLDPKKRAAIQKIVRYYDLLAKAGVTLDD